MTGTEKRFESLLEFNNSPEKVITPELHGVIVGIAETGRVYYDWAELRPFIAYKLEHVLLQFDTEAGENSYCDGERSLQESIRLLLESFHSLPGPPFTLQRMCEVLLEPGKHYRKTIKLLNALAKLCSVTSVIPQSSPEDQGPDGAAKENMASDMASETTEVAPTETVGTTASDLV
eukprot:Rmarinus@m.25462